MVLEQVAVDIETTGFNVDDKVTVVEFAVPMGCRVFVQTGGRRAPDVEETVRANAPVHMHVSTHTSEDTLFEAVGRFVEERLRDDDMLTVAYNGERWRGGFDLPFLRTRYAKLDFAWPFVDVLYADVMPVVTDRFNTTIDDDERGDLASVYEVLCDGTYGDMDPFAGSEEAVAAFDGGRFAALVLHNVADVVRTRALGRLAEQYCSKSDFKLKLLTPTVQEK